MKEFATLKDAQVDNTVVAIHCERDDKWIGYEAGDVVPAPDEKPTPELTTDRARQILADALNVDVPHLLLLFQVAALNK